MLLKFLGFESKHEFCIQVPLPLWLTSCPRGMPLNIFTSKDGLGAAREI